MVHEAAIKPWQYEHWIFPRDPRFAEKAGPILDLYTGMGEREPLSTKDYVLCLDEKTSIQARQRSHDEMPPKPKRSRRVIGIREAGSVQYLAAWDVHRGIVPGRCEAKTGIRPFGRLVDQVLEQEPYRDAERLFMSWIMVRRIVVRRRWSGCIGGQKDHLGPHARARELVEPGGDLLFDHAAESVDAERFRDYGRSPSALALLRTTDEIELPGRLRGSSLDKTC